jgi:hypothetical protein
VEKSIGFPHLELTCRSVWTNNFVLNVRVGCSRKGDAEDVLGNILRIELVNGVSFPSGSILINKISNT